MFRTKSDPEPINSAEVIDQAHKKLKAIKYPAKAISNAMVLKKKLNQLNQSIRGKLEAKIDKNINAYRQVRGDGNCFFRALAFSYITNRKTAYFEDIFTHFKDLSLESCRKETIPKEFQPFYNDRLLKDVLRRHWEREYQFFIQITQEKYGFRNYKRALARMLTENPYLDFIIILYFRAICLSAFSKRK